MRWKTGSRAPFWLDESACQDFPGAREGVGVQAQVWVSLAILTVKSSQNMRQRCLTLSWDAGKRKDTDPIQQSHELDMVRFLILSFLHFSRRRNHKICDALQGTEGPDYASACFLLQARSSSPRSIHAEVSNQRVPFFLKDSSSRDMTPSYLSGGRAFLDTDGHMPVLKRSFEVSST